MEVAGLLNDAAAGAEYFSLSLNLRAHCSLDAAKRVDVLGLAARAPWIPRLVEREVDVASQRPLFHAHIADTKGAQYVAQFGDIGLRHLRRQSSCAGNRLGDDLDERDAGAVVVDERIVGAVDATGGTTGVRQLARVFFHMHALDFNAKLSRAVFGVYGDVEVSV